MEDMVLKTPPDGGGAESYPEGSVGEAWADGGGRASGAEAMAEISAKIDLLLAAQGIEYVGGGHEA